LSAPVATNTCGTALPVRYGWIAVFDGVPRAPKMNATPSDSTSFLVCSSAFAGT